MATTDSAYQGLFLSTHRYGPAQPSYQLISAASTTTQQPAITFTHHHNHPLSFPTSEMTYLGQTLIPSGYPVQQQAPYPQASPSYSFHDIEDRQLQAWLQSNQQHSTPDEATQQQQLQLYDEYRQQHCLQAGSRRSISSSRASIDLSPQHLQAGVYNHISPILHHSPQSDYVAAATQPQHHHHHSLPAQSPRNNVHSSDFGESSLREREQGGAPMMVGSEGMPEPAPRPKGPKLKFTRADDALLIELKEGKNLTWKQIADFFPGRSSGTLQVRYCTKLKAKSTVWTDDMLNRLRIALAEYENDKWRIISSKVGNGFSSSACQDKAEELELAEPEAQSMLEDGPNDTQRL